MKKKIFISVVFIFLISLCLILFTAYKFGVDLLKKDNDNIDLIPECYSDSECVPEEPLIGVRYICESAVCISKSFGNPASTKCQEAGGRIDIRKNIINNKEYGVCIFDNGSECEEWRFLHKTCSPDDFYPSEDKKWSGVIVESPVVTDGYYFELLNGSVIGIGSDNVNMLGVLSALKSHSNLISVSGNILDVVDDVLDKKINVIEILDLGGVEFNQISEADSLDLAMSAIEGVKSEDITEIKTTNINCPYCWKFRLSYRVGGDVRFTDVIVQEGEVRDVEDIDGIVFSGCTEFSMADMCTMQYDPVCAKIKKTDLVIEWKTFSNACVACTLDDSDKEVIGYEMGECITIQ